MRLSPDGKRLAVGRANPGAPELWIYDLERGSATRIAVGVYSGIWSPDGKKIAFAQGYGDDQENVWIAATTTSADAQLLLDRPQRQIPSSWSPDGSRLLVQENRPGTNLDIFSVSIADGSVEPFLESPANEGHPSFSPDGRWIAYTSDESGSGEIYVRASGGSGERHEISIRGGNFPVWSADGRTLYYMAPRGLMATPVSSEPDFRAGTPTLLFEVISDTAPDPYIASKFDVCHDDSCFFVEVLDQTGNDKLSLIQNWTTKLERLAPQRR